MIPRACGWLRWGTIITKVLGFMTHHSRENLYYFYSFWLEENRFWRDLKPFTTKPSSQKKSNPNQPLDIRKTKATKTRIRNPKDIIEFSFFWIKYWFILCTLWIILSMGVVPLSLLLSMVWELGEEPKANSWVVTFFIDLTLVVGDSTPSLERP